MPPEDALDARLRRRWAKHGGGPELERRLKAAEAELARRANVETAERRGVRVPETSRVPVSDPTTGPTPRASSRPSVGTAEDSAVAPSPPRTPIRVDDVLADARALTRSQTRRAAASDGPRSGGIPNVFAPGALDDDDSDDETRALEARCHVVADAFIASASPALGDVDASANASASPRPPPTNGLDDETSLAPFLELKAAANEALAENDVELANALYDEAIDRLSAFRENGGDDTGRRYGDEAEREAKNDAPPTAKKSPANRADDLTAVFLSNRARCKLLLRPPDAHGAVEDAERSVAMRADWHVPYDRAAKAHAMLGNWKRAVDFCRGGERAASAARAVAAAAAFATQLDDVAMRAAREGSLAGFYGRLIYVRSAGEDAWLCREAPANPAFDDDEEAFDDETLGKRDVARRSAGAPVHARSLRDALERAEDGDRVVLLRGVHNGCGDSVTVTKRVLITGEGALRDAVVDARNNSPIFRLRRACWIANVDFDFTGFSEVLRVESGEGERARHPNPLIERCGVKCSGSDAVVVAAEARPTFRDCAFEAKKTGARACGSAAIELVDCKFSGCERQGLRCTESAQAVARSCVFAENGHEGVVATGSSSVDLRDCVLRDNGGPGLDVSGRARASLARCAVAGNVGGVFAWDDGEVEMARADVRGGKSHAVLVDENAACVCHDRTRVRGVVHANDETREAIAPGADGSCVVEHPATPTDLPPETGCFKFEHDQYLRKQ